MKLLVTGGLGYIGSHTVRALLAAGDEVVILDNSSTGHAWAAQGCEVLSVDLRDLGALDQALGGRGFEGVIHFAAKSLVGESREQPLLYYQNNVAGTANLVEAMLAANIPKLVFSSTAAIFGNPVSEQIDESHPKAPINVYGRTKLVIEEMLEAVTASTDFSAVCLRYFNAAGASTQGDIGEWHEPETHLIPNALRAASGAGPALTLFGDDYPTPDGTCIRDYIHVEDLADAHLRAIKQMPPKGFATYNLGNGTGFSVKQILAACEKAVGKPIPHTIGPRREGDPATLVASSAKARRELGWAPVHTDIDEIVATAWGWERYRLANLVN
jgi:UDP-glucose 4-epimerase